MRHLARGHSSVIVDIISFESFADSFVNLLRLDPAARLI